MTAPAKTITFKRPLQFWTMNDRLHWRAVDRIKKQWKRAAFTAALGDAGKTKADRLPPCSVFVVFGVRDPGRHRDPHNWAPTVKTIIDSFVKAGIWPDDDQHWVRVLDPSFEKTADPSRPHVRVELHPRPLCGVDGCQAVIDLPLLPHVHGDV